MFSSEIAVIGLGEVGSQTFAEMNKKADVMGVDTNETLVDEFREQGYRVYSSIPHSSIYVICVYTTEQVLEIIKKIWETGTCPMFIIESTILPGTCDKLIMQYPGIRLVLCPHRFNPNDPEHHVFNLNRLLGASDPHTRTEAVQFYKRFMPSSLIHITSLKIAEICKPMENAYRFVEIVIAQEIDRICCKLDIDFKDLREAMNTKWNIDVKEARDGVKGKCLPKDIKLIDETFGRESIFSLARILNDDYIIYVE